jgi:hypothetical protein
MSGVEMLVVVLGPVSVVMLIDYACKRFFHHKEEFTRRMMRQGGRHDG